MYFLFILLWYSGWITSRESLFRLGPCRWCHSYLRSAHINSPWWFSWILS